MKIQKINTIKLNNNKQHQKISFGERKVEKFSSENNENAKNSKLYEHTRDIFAFLGGISFIIVLGVWYHFRKQTHKLKM